ncbi:3-deoxy-7-phosphoheptulonate synthase [Corallincola luteus]|uniref:chorismate mutase n=1 Tax=Corallincola luteus TaxID=1775177 RepID=A0ABY2APN2_9GAMM|nr:3-deoxy-7-phosphoheptulonate synthase [Corallincola luteus]TCI05159.1 3-deoxy-7-phosphoheptulonate synthase [Corallincola luteus]
MDKPLSLDDIRKEITELDTTVLKLLSRRRELSLDVARSKIEATRPVRDQTREEALLVTLIKQGRELDLDAHYVTQIYHTIIEDSVLTQQAMLQQLANPENRKPVYRVAFLGDKGSYSYLAMRKYFSRTCDDLVERGCTSFSQIINEVESGTADYAMLPIENTSSGGITQVYDVLQHTTCSIVGEMTLPVEHCLLTAVPSSESQINTIYAHFQPAQQCSEYLDSLTGIKIESCDASSAAFLKVSELKDPHVAAIGSADGGELYGLTPIKTGLANQKENFSRFIVIARKPVQVAEQIPAKTTLIMSVEQKPGSLVEALLVMREHGLNMCKLESRPIQGNPWEELFYIDVEGNLQSSHMQSALEALTRITRYLKVLGCYPSEEVSPTHVPLDKLPLPNNTATSASKTESAAASAHSLVARNGHPDTEIRVRHTVIGSDQFITIAGPGIIESQEQLNACAQQAKECGAAILRGALYPPQINQDGNLPNEQQSLQYLREAGLRFDLPFITEVHHPEQVTETARQADLLQIGARNMQNIELLQEVGRTHRPIILKRGLMASLDELLQAAEVIMAQGNRQVILCERGIRTFEGASRQTLDLGAIPALKSMTHLPVIVDPTHAISHINQLAPLVYAAKAAGANGIILDIHPQPAAALSDGETLDFDSFAEIMSELRQR